MAIPRDTVGGLSGGDAVCGLSAGNDTLGGRRFSQLKERDGACARFEPSLDLLSETDNLLACLKPA